MYEKWKPNQKKWSQVKQKPDMNIVIGIVFFFFFFATDKTSLHKHFTRDYTTAKNIKLISVHTHTQVYICFTSTWEMTVGSRINNKTINHVKFFSFPYLNTHSYTHPNEVVCVCDISTSAAVCTSKSQIRPNQPKV